MNLDGSVWWVIHTECPIQKRFFQERRSDILIALTVTLERELEDHELNHWLITDRISKNIEAFSVDPCKVTKLRKYKAPMVFP